jgi:type I restriction enzyme R subunit
MDGKAMVVCMSRRICVELYKRDRALRPGVGDDADEQGAMKVVMTGSATDPLAVAAAHPQQAEARRPGQAVQAIPRTRSRIVIVRDMWLTGFDAPCLHTMYVDKPMRGHGLMQAIARVNRVFKDKPGGLVVDYLGLARRTEGGAGDLYRERRHRATAIDQDRGRRV